MSDVFDETWASDDDALITTPSAAEIRQGFRCGPADPGVFNYLFQSLISAINSLNIGDMASKFRLISTTEGLAGGGSLENDRTLRLDFAGLEPETAIANDDIIGVFDVSANKHVGMTRGNFVAGLGGEGGSLITAGTNVGTGEGAIYSGVSGGNLLFRKVKAGDGISAVVATDDVVISLASRGSELTIS